MARSRNLLCAAACLFASAARAQESSPIGYALSPVFGYDPTSGPIVGGALFAAPKVGGAGLEAALQARFAPLNGGGGAVSVGAEQRRAWDSLWPRARAAFSSLPGSYFGRGMATDPGASVPRSPRRFDAALGLVWSPASALELSAEALVADLRDASSAFLAAAAPQEGGIEGWYAGGRLELVLDRRDARRAPTSGLLSRAWLEEWPLQAGQRAPRTRLGAAATGLLPVFTGAVLALHIEGAWSAGADAFLTTFELGGANLLRGYAPGRFRGDALAGAAAELRLPLWPSLSTALFAEAGRAWAASALPGGTALAADAGLSARWALPPDQVVQLRFDVARGRDQTSVYVSFGEPF